MTSDGAINKSRCLYLSQDWKDMLASIRLCHGQGLFRANFCRKKFVGLRANAWPVNTGTKSWFYNWQFNSAYLEGCSKEIQLKLISWNDWQMSRCTETMFNDNYYDKIGWYLEGTFSSYSLHSENLNNISHWVTNYEQL